MGMYDTYGNCQLKVGDVGLGGYKIGDTVEIPDGIYLCNEGAIVIKDSIFIAEFETVMTKWGNELIPYELIDNLNPITQFIKNKNQPNP